MAGAWQVGSDPLFSITVILIIGIAALIMAMMVIAFSTNNIITMTTIIGDLRTQPVACSAYVLGTVIPSFIP